MVTIKSIIQSDNECYVCGSPYTEEHHIFYGTANRKLSERYGLKIRLCPLHHRGNDGVHFNKALDTRLKDMAQRQFEQKYDEDFVKVFGRNYKED